jgi:hypothetical protein
MPSVAGFASAVINYALNAPAVGTNFPLSIDGSAVTSGTVSASNLPVAGAAAAGIVTTGTQTFAGTKTFTSTIAGSINGNAATVTNGVYTTGDQTIFGTKSFDSIIYATGGVRASGGAPGPAGADNRGYAFFGGGDNDSGMYSSADAQLDFYTDAMMRHRITTTQMYTNIQHYIATGSNRAGDFANRTLYLEQTQQPGIGFHSPGLSASILKWWGPGNVFELRNQNDNGWVPISASAFNVSSDYRLKEDVSDLQNCLSDVLKLRPVIWKWKSDKSLSHGFIAHEIQEHFPLVVTGEKDQATDEGIEIYQSVDYGKISTILVKAIQEQQAIIDDLKSRLEALEAK